MVLRPEEDTRSNEVLPFLKWAGGKRWLVPNQLDEFPDEYNRYFEPFLGSGAVFFALNPKSAVLSDTNQDLIEVYTAIKLDWRRVMKELRRHQKRHDENPEEYYYAQRACRRRSIFTKAGQFIYLNRTCWNGLYRVNLDGQFNVPKGARDTILRDSDNFQSISSLLKNVTLQVVDFEDVIAMAEPNDLVYADPPYTVEHKNNNFIRSNDELFSWHDQIRLRNALLDARRRGVHVVASNGNHRSIRELYKEFFEMKAVMRKSTIAAEPQHRGVAQELLIRSRT